MMISWEDSVHYAFIKLQTGPKRLFWVGDDYWEDSVHYGFVKQ